MDMSDAEFYAELDRRFGVDAVIVHKPKDLDYYIIMHHGGDWRAKLQQVLDR